MNQTRFPQILTVSWPTEARLVRVTGRGGGLVGMRGGKIKKRGIASLGGSRARSRRGAVVGGG